MVTFRDVKAFFNNVANVFNSIGLLVNGLPWPLSELRAPFYTLRDWFQSADWIWDGVQLWLLTIEQTALGAKYWTDQAFAKATEAMNWINTTGSAAYSLATSAYNVANNAWSWITTGGEYALNTAMSAFNLALEASTRSLKNLEAITWINSIEIPNLHTAIAEIWAAIEALEVPDLTAIIQDILTLKTWRDNFITGLDETIADVISRTIDGILDRVKW